MVKGAALVELDGEKFYFGCNVLGKLLALLRDAREMMFQGYDDYQRLRGMEFFDILSDGVK